MNSKILFVPLLLATTAVAQTQLVRGDIESISGTNQFRLDCTDIQLVSRTVNLQQLHNASQQQKIDYEMQVNLVGSNPTVLDVVSAVPIAEILDMGNLRIGRSDSWEVRGTPGSAAAVFLTARSLTSYLPFGTAGTWLLGSTNVLVNQGKISGQGQLRFDLTPPNLPALVGAEFTSQALVAEPSGLLITNPGCKVLQNR